MKPWPRCPWPHQILTLAEDREFTLLVERLRTLITRRAIAIARRDRDLADELAQSVLIMLWRQGAKRAAATPRAFMKVAIKQTMKRTLIRETRQRVGRGRLPSRGPLAALRTKSKPRSRAKQATQAKRANRAKE